MEASPPQQSSAKNQCGEEEPPIDDVSILEEIPQEDPVDDLTIENAAFSQYHILKKILSFLNPDDLENCWGVSKHWREVAETLVPVHYEITMSVKRPNSIVLYKRARLNQRISKGYKLDLSEVTKTLEAALLTHNQNVVLSVKTWNLSFEREHLSVKNFLLKFGPLVQHFGLYSDAVVCRNFLLTAFPNLKTLQFISHPIFKDSPDYEGFNPDLPKNQFKQLKKIQFGWYENSHFEMLGKFLKIGPNLKEIIHFPLPSINDLMIADKVQALKSVSYSVDYSENGLTIASAFEKLAQHQPKLSSFYLNLNICKWEEESTIEMVKAVILSILRSSADSLRTFEMSPAAEWGFVNIPQLKGVRTLIFHKCCEERFFSAGISLEEIFPNVSEIRLAIASWEESSDVPWDESINKDLPEITNSSWVSQIKRLDVWKLPLSSLPTLQKLFPLIEDLKFTALITEIAELLRAFPKYCPHLKSMTINVQREREKLMDCAFTGLSPDVVAQLLDPAQRGIFSDAQIEAFKSQSPISKLTDLRRLTLKASYVATLETLTHVSYEFGFRLVPHLKVYVAEKNSPVKVTGIRDWQMGQEQNLCCEICKN